MSDVTSGTPARRRQNRRRQWERQWLANPQAQREPQMEHRRHAQPDPDLVGLGDRSDLNADWTG
jgi:hypothetical protein